MMFTRFNPLQLCLHVIPFLLLFPFASNGQLPLKDSIPPVAALKNLKQEFSADPLPASSNYYIQIDSGVVVNIKLLNEISSKSVNEGDILNFAVAADVIVNDKVLIKSETPVTGKVEKANQARGLGKGGEINFSLNYVKAVDGSKVYLRPSNPDIEGKNRVGGAVVLGALNPLFLMHKGKNAKMGEGEIIQAYTDREYKIEIAE